MCASPRVPFALLLMLCTTVSSAHDYWLDDDGDGYLLYRGHRHSSHQGERIVPYDPAIIQRVTCVSAAGQTERITPARVYPTRIPGPCAALLVEADSGSWTQTLTGTTNQPRDEVFGALRSWHALEGVKRLETWSPALRRSLGGGLELTPTSDPFRLRPGDKLRLVVTLQGRPYAGVTVAYDGEARGVTGDDGRINLRIRHTGTQVITASLDQPTLDSSADKRVRSTALFFDLP